MRGELPQGQEHGKQVQVHGRMEQGRGRPVQVQGRGKRGPACTQGPVCKREHRSCCLASSRAPSPRRPR